MTRALPCVVAVAAFALHLWWTAMAGRRNQAENERFVADMVAHGYAELPDYAPSWPGIALLVVALVATCLCKT